MQAMRSESFAGKILSEAFSMVTSPLELPKPLTFAADIAADVVVDSLAELPAAETAGFYPYVVGKAADVGWGRSLRSLLSPIWANAAWYNMLLAMNISTLHGSEDGLLDLLSLADMKQLFDFLRSIVAAAGGVTTDTESPPLKSVRLELTSRSLGDSGYSSDASNKDAGSASASSPAEVRVQIELVATMVDSASTITPSPASQPCLAGQYLVITSIASNIPCMPTHNPTASMPEPLLSTRPADSIAPPPEVDGFPFPPTMSPTTQAPSGFILENQSKPKRTRSRRWGRGVRSVRSPSTIRDMVLSGGEEEECITISPLGTPGKNPDSDMMEWDSTRDLASKNDSEVVSEHIPRDLLTNDPFCMFLATLPMGRLILAFPWHETSLGSLTSWSGDLKSLITVMLASPFRESLWVGDDGVML